MVGISKIGSVFLLGYPQTLTKAPVGRGGRAIVIYKFKIFEGEDFKNEIIFTFRITADPPSQGGVIWVWKSRLTRRLLTSEDLIDYQQFILHVMSR